MSGETTDLDLLADYAAGVLNDVDEVAAIETLLATDPEWRATYDTMARADTAVRDDLRALAAEPVEPMPAEVADRLTLIIAGAETTPTAEKNPTPQSAQVIDLARAGARRGGRRRNRYLLGGAAAAGLALVMAGSALVATLSSLTTSSDTGAESNSAAAPPMGTRGAAPGDASTEFGSTVTLTASGTTYGPSDIDSGLDGEWPGLGPSGDRSGAPDGPEMVDPGEGDPSGNTSRSDGQSSPGYRLGPLPDPAAVPAGLAGLTDPGMLTACLDAIVDLRGGSPVSADYATFSGSPALVVVLAGGTVRPGQTTQVVVAGPRCGSDDADVQFTR